VRWVLAIGMASLLSAALGLGQVILALPTFAHRHALRRAAFIRWLMGNRNGRPVSSAGRKAGRLGGAAFFNGQPKAGWCGPALPVRICRRRESCRAKRWWFGGLVSSRRIPERFLCRLAQLMQSVCVTNARRDIQTRYCCWRWRLFRDIFR